MKAEETDEVVKLYYNIHEVATRFECNTSKIRFWCDSFDLNPKRNNRGNRRFSKKDVAVLDQIHYLVEIEGRTLKAAKAVLESGSTYDLHGHGELCPACQEPCDSLAGNPAKWPTFLYQKFYHQGCLHDIVQARLDSTHIELVNKVQTYKKALHDIYEMSITKNGPIALKVINTLKETKDE